VSLRTVCPSALRAPGSMRVSRPEPGNRVPLVMIAGFITVLAIFLIIGIVIL